MTEPVTPPWIHPQLGRRVASYESPVGVIGGFLLRVVRRVNPTIEVFERGMRLVWRTTHEIAFDAVKSVRISTTDVFHGASYLLTQCDIHVLVSVDSEVHWRGSLARHDVRFREIRQTLCAPLARQLLEKVRVEGRAPWVPGVWLAKDRIDVDPAIAPGRTRRYAIPLHELVIDMQPGTCVVRSRADSGGGLSIEHKDSNFFPGLIALEGLRASDQKRT